jgi:heme-degrading monooxygenase HmoA
MAGSKSLLHIKTDLTGEYHRVVVVSQYENLASWEKAQEEYMNPTEEMKKSMEKMKGFQDMYVSGSREIFKVW